MQKIKVNIKIKHVIVKDKIKQYFAILSYSDFFLEDSYSFYRHLKKFLESFYLKNKIINITEGLNQYEIHYNKDGPDTCPEDIDEFLDFTITSKEERICDSCEYYKDKKCLFYEKEITEIPPYCFYWSEKE